MNATIDTAKKNQMVRFLILQKMAEGMSASEAMDAVCGAGTYKRLAGELWTALRQRQGLPVD